MKGRESILSLLLWPDCSLSTLLRQLGCCWGVLLRRLDRSLTVLLHRLSRSLSVLRHRLDCSLGMLLRLKACLSLWLLPGFKVDLSSLRRSVSHRAYIVPGRRFSGSLWRFGKRGLHSWPCFISFHDCPSSFIYP